MQAILDVKTIFQTLYNRKCLKLHGGYQALFFICAKFFRSYIRFIWYYFYMEINLLPYQLRILKETPKRKYLAIIGGTGTGKTHFLPIWLYIQITSHPGEEFIVSSPTIPMLKRNPIKYIERFLKQNNISYEFNKTDMIMKINGSTVYFISAKDADRMQGIHAKAIIGDEAGLFERHWWDTAVQRVAYKKGKILLLTTPYSLNWLKTEVYDRFLQGHQDYYVENPTSIDNPFYPKEQYHKAKETLPDWKFKMLFEGKFTKPAGLIYPQYEIVERFPIPTEWNKYRGVDFGFNNPFAVIWIAENPKTGEYYIYKEFKKSNMDIEDMYHVLSKEPDLITYADPASKEVLESLKKRGIRIRPAKKDVLAGISYVHSLFKSRKLKVFKSCKLTIDELETYQWETDRAGNVIDKPKKENDHLLDGLRYCLFTLNDKTETPGNPILKPQIVEEEKPWWIF